MAVQKHIHKLKRHIYKNKTAVYFCTLNCTYKIDPALAEGKLALCSRCLNPFYMTGYSVTLKEPHCARCHGKGKVAKVEDNSLTVPIIEERRETDRREAIPGRRVVDIPLAVLPVTQTVSLKDRMARLSQPLSLTIESDSVHDTTSSSPKITYETIPSSSESINDDLL